MKTNIDQIKSRVLPILKKEGVTKAGIFGSYVRGEAKKDSDIDILIDFPRGKGLFAFAGLKLDLEDALGKKVDLVTYNSIHRLLKDQILAEQIRIL